MSPSRANRPPRLVVAGLAACLFAAAGAVASSGSGTPTDSPADQPAASAAGSAPALAPSPPSSLIIERLGLSTDVVQLRAAPDGKSLELPPLERLGWDSTSATPGQAGVTVVTGFISRSAKQPGALRHLGRLRPGDVVALRRNDEHTVDYRVTDIAYYPQGTFPAERVFARADRPELRLISTGGPLREGDGLGNAVVTAVAEPAADPALTEP